MGRESDAHRCVSRTAKTYCQSETLLHMSFPPCCLHARGRSGEVAPQTTAGGPGTVTQRHNRAHEGIASDNRCNKLVSKAEVQAVHRFLTLIWAAPSCSGRRGGGAGLLQLSSHGARSQKATGNASSISEPHGRGRSRPCGESQERCVWRHFCSFCPISRGTFAPTRGSRACTDA